MYVVVLLLAEASQVLHWRATVRLEPASLSHRRLPQWQQWDVTMTALLANLQLPCSFP